MHDLLKPQHKGVIEAIRSGGLEQLFGSPAAAAAERTSQIPAFSEAAASSVARVNGELVLNWLNSGAVYEQNSIIMRFAVSCQGSQVAGAQLISRLMIGDEPPIYTQATTDAAGQAEMRVMMAESSLADAAILVQARHQRQHA